MPWRGDAHAIVTTAWLREDAIAASSVTGRVDGVSARLKDRTPRHGRLREFGLGLLHLDLLLVFEANAFLLQLHALVRDLLRPGIQVPP